MIRKELTMYANLTNSYQGDLYGEHTWRDIYPALRSLARYLVYTAHVPSWKGQEEDIIEDVVQETARRLLLRAQKAERGEASPIVSLTQMMTAIAQNYCKDLRRRDYRLSHELPSDVSSEIRDEQSHLLETITESIYQEGLFKLLAHEIATFPDKQRTAVLIDLANRMSFDAQPTPLQKAFLAAGIQLQQYRRPLPAHRRERARHTALLSYAYKRIAHLPCVQQYITAA
jgi:hypothetical protein